MFVGGDLEGNGELAFLLFLGVGVAFGGAGSLGKLVDFYGNEIVLGSGGFGGVG